MRQIAVLPYRTLGLAVDAPIQILLITSRETRRWVIPKGGLMKGLPPHSAAAVALRWVTQQGVVAVTSADEASYITEDLDSFAIDLTAAEVKALGKVV